ncbi:MAG: flagellar filament capping protein FliD [Lachnospiraceae bacterium]|nr:flagellar filament capping protein FliD [Lachnospiraceae bacterium]
MAMRVSGMMSGMDTESIVQQLVAARQTKVDSLKKKQTSLEWKQDAWKELNNKILKLYNGTIGTLKYRSSYSKKTTAVSNSNLVSVITDDSAMDSVQNLKISKLAKAGYMTGAQLTGTDGSKLTSGSKVTESLGIEAGSKFEVATKGKTTEITIDENTTMNSLVNQLKAAGVNANFDAEQQRLYIGATETGVNADFTLTASNSNGTDALNKLGILNYDENTMAAYKKYADMSDDDIQSLIDSRVEARRAAYMKDRDALKTSNEKLVEKRNKLLEEFEKDTNVKDLDLENSDADSRKDLMDEINRQLKDLEDLEKENGTLDQDEIKERNKLKSQLSAIKSYDNNEASIAKNNEKIEAIDEYVDENGVVSAKLTEEEETSVNDKIAEAKAMFDEDGKPKSTLQGSGAIKQAGQDSEIELNGVKYTSDSNTIKVNGLTITCNGETAENETITLTTRNDTSGIYNMVKKFITEYSALINEMDKLYNADSAKGYEPLTDEEKDAMSDSEIEKWETKVKDSLLRRDSTLNSVSSALKEIMASGFSVNGKTMYLHDFGIETLGYFEAADNEKNAYHINGDEDDTAVMSKTNTLMAMISSDPDAVTSFFSQLNQKLSDKLFKMMGTTESSSFNKIYDDKKMKEDYDSYTSKIAQAEKKLQDYEDKWYKKFAKMETAMAKMQSNSSAVMSLLGG